MFELQRGDCSAEGLTVRDRNCQPFLVDYVAKVIVTTRNRPMPNSLLPCSTAEPIRA